MTITGRELTVGLMAPPVGAAVAGAAVRALRGANCVCVSELRGIRKKGRPQGEAKDLEKILSPISYLSYLLITFGSSLQNVVPLPVCRSAGHGLRHGPAAAHHRWRRSRASNRRHGACRTHRVAPHTCSCRYTCERATKAHSQGEQPHRGPRGVDDP